MRSRIRSAGGLALSVELMVLAAVVSLTIGITVSVRRTRADVRAFLERIAFYCRVLIDSFPEIFAATDATAKYNAL